MAVVAVAMRYILWIVQNCVAYQRLVDIVSEPNVTHDREMIEKIKHLHGYSGEYASRCSRDKSKSTVKSDNEPRELPQWCRYRYSFNKSLPYQHFIIRISFNLSFCLLFHCEFPTLFSHRKNGLYFMSSTAIVAHLPSSGVSLYVNDTHFDTENWKKQIANRPRKHFIK